VEEALGPGSAAEILRSRSLIWATSAASGSMRACTSVMVANEVA